MEKSNENAPKNCIRHVKVNYGEGPIHKNELEYFKGFIGAEYTITEKEQILPLLNVTLERVEFLIVWRDNNFQPSNPDIFNFKKCMILTIKLKNIQHLI